MRIPDQERQRIRSKAAAIFDSISPLIPTEGRHHDGPLGCGHGSRLVQNDRTLPGDRQVDEGKQSLQREDRRRGLDPKRPVRDNRTGRSPYEDCRGSPQKLVLLSIATLSGSNERLNMEQSTDGVGAPVDRQFAMPLAVKFGLGDLVRKKSGAAWQGRVVGWYSTKLTPEGYAVESEAHPGSVQIYPVGALEPVA